MTLRTTTTVFPGGWRYNQLDASGKLLKAFRSMNEYHAFIAQITQFRVVNKLPRATYDEVDTDAQQFMCEQVGGDPRLCDGGVKKNSWSSPLQRTARVVARAVRAAKTVGTGSRILADWVGEGLVPVPVKTAQARADICTTGVGGGSCPHNREGVDFAKLSGIFAQFVYEQMQKKTQLKLTVSGEENLHHCDICLCDLKLKVWTPMHTILNRTTNDVLLKFRQEAPPNCWMLKTIKPPA